jgi:hypothetical protein
VGPEQRPSLSFTFKASCSVCSSSRRNTGLCQQATVLQWRVSGPSGGECGPGGGEYGVLRCETVWKREEFKMALTFLSCVT